MSISRTVFRDYQEVAIKHLSPSAIAERYIACNNIALAYYCVC